MALSCAWAQLQLSWLSARWQADPEFVLDQRTAATGRCAKNLIIIRHRKTSLNNGLIRLWVSSIQAVLKLIICLGIYHDINTEI